MKHVKIIIALIIALFHWSHLLFSFPNFIFSAKCYFAKYFATYTTKYYAGKIFESLFQSFLVKICRITSVFVLRKYICISMLIIHLILFILLSTIFSIVFVNKWQLLVRSVHKMANVYRNIFDTSKYFNTSLRDCSSCFSKIQINEILEH